MRRSDRSCAGNPVASGGSLRFTLRVDDELAESLRREQPRDVGDLHRVAEPLGRNLGQIAPELSESGFGQYTFLLELRLGHVAARILDDLAARNLDLGPALEAEDHVEKIDRLRVEAFDQRYVELDLIDIAAERIGHRFRDLGKNRL